MNKALAITLSLFSFMWASTCGVLADGTYPLLTIRKAAYSKEGVLTIQVEMSSSGKDIIALGAEQISVHLFNSEKETILICENLFNDTFPDIFTIHPKHKYPLLISYNLLKDKEAAASAIKSIAAKSCFARVYISSGKSPMFDHQFLGSTSSENKTIEVSGCESIGGSKQRKDARQSGNK